MAVQRVSALGWLPCGTDIKARRFADMDVLISAFADAAADDGEVFFLIAARRVGIDEGGFARYQVAVSHDAVREIF